MIDLLENVIRIAKESGGILEESLGKKMTFDYKSSINFVTNIDLEVQKKIISSLKELYPNHKFLAEEGNYNKTYKGDLWIIDPLDGTTNYSHSLLTCSVSIAHVTDKKVDLGVIFDPFRKEMFYAEYGKGSFLNGKKIMVSNVEEFSKTLLIAEFAYNRGEKLTKTLNDIEKLLRTGILDVRMIGSAALDLCYVSCGRVDGFWAYGIKPWDHAAGSLILTEAGGKITTAKGNKYDIFDNNVLASNGKLHNQIVNCLR
jgi:myo-inositol-1(or 4)-monophosphatase